MVVCRFFASGNCKFGNNCRFEHIGTGGINRENYGGNYYNNSYQQSNSYNARNAQPSYGFSTNNRFGALSEPQTDKYTQKPANTTAKTTSFNDFVTSVCTEIEAAQKGKQWPFSCFGPVGQNSGNYAGLDDTSQEELRWEAYQSRQQGSMQSYIQGIEQLCKKHDAICREILSRSSNVTDLLGKFYYNPSQSATQTEKTSTFGQSGGNTATASNFSFSLTHLNTNPQNPAPAFSTTNAFGQTSQSAPFGQTSQPSPFGQQPNQFAANNSWSAAQPFGSSATQTTFNQTQTQNLPAFGTGTNSSLTNPTYEPPKSTASIFGGNISAFGTSSSSNAPSVNGVISQGTKITQVTQEGETSTNEIYTPNDKLTKEERQCFTAPTFTLGRIPVRPPPKELCLNLISR